MWKIQVVTDNQIFWWHDTGLMELRWLGRTFSSFEEVNNKCAELRLANPNWFVQWKKVNA